MEFKKKKCSLPDHTEIDANGYCRECKVYMCSKCEKFHSQLCKKHKFFILDNNDNEEIFTGFCNEEKHQMELEFFCKTHNQLVCAACISKIKKNEIGKHKDCNVCVIEDIKDDKINSLKENMKSIEEFSKVVEESIIN